MKTFKFAPGLDLRVIERDGEPWFVAKDVCDALGLPPNNLNGSYQAHTKRLDQDEVLTQVVRDPTTKNSRRQYTVSESGLHSLILRSRQPGAKEFKRWVTQQVLPTIRKTGGYMVPAVAAEVAEDPMKAMARAVQMLVRGWGRD